MLEFKTSKLAPGGRRREQPRHFHFPVTWTSLVDRLELREITDIARPAARQPQALVLAAAAAAPMGQRRAEASNGRWEMVVPKMVRPAAKTFAPERALPVASEPSPDPKTAIPMFSNYENKALFSRAFSAVEKRTRAFLAGRDPAAARGEIVPVVPIYSEPKNEDWATAPDRQANREMLLSKIAHALRSRPHDPIASLLTLDRERKR